MEKPFAGGVSAFCSISDNYYLPQLSGVTIDKEKGLFTTNTLVINSLGNVEIWRMTFQCTQGFDYTAQRMNSPKMSLRVSEVDKIESAVKEMADDEIKRLRLKQFVVNEYYSAIIYTSGKMAVLENTIEALIKREVLSEHDRDIVRAVVKAVPEWFTSSA